MNYHLKRQRIQCCLRSRAKKRSSAYLDLPAAGFLTRGTGAEPAFRSRCISSLCSRRVSSFRSRSRGDSRRADTTFVFECSPFLGGCLGRGSWNSDQWRPLCCIVMYQLAVASNSFTLRNSRKVGSISVHCTISSRVICAKRIRTTRFSSSVIRSGRLKSIQLFMAA